MTDTDLFIEATRGRDHMAVPRREQPKGPAREPDLAGRLRQARHAAGLTQSELARRAGLSQAGVSGIEHGLAAPRAETVARLAAALGVGERWLAGEG